METKGFFKFEIIINVLVWIPMLWVYSRYKYVCNRLYTQNLTSDEGPRAKRVQISPILK